MDLIQLDKETRHGFDAKDELDSPGKHGFVHAHSQEKFVPWGFNYDHDESAQQRLLEEYWLTEWAKVEKDFHEMKKMGLNPLRLKKPILVEEIFPLHCSIQYLQQYFEQSKTRVSGWISFFWGETIDQSRSHKDSHLVADWLDAFAKLKPEVMDIQNDGPDYLKLDDAR